jgi:hypothetical protein
MSPTSYQTALPRNKKTGGRNLSLFGAMSKVTGAFGLRRRCGFKYLLLLDKFRHSVSNRGTEVIPVLNKIEWSIAELGRTLLILLVGAAIAGPAAAGNIYSWRTDSGDVAFTDDIGNVPARYREQVMTRPTEPLADYARFSAQDREESEDYAEQLQARLAHLQRLNDSYAPQEVDYPEFAGTAAVRIGGSDQVLTLTGGDIDAPVIVERVRVMGEGQIATRHDILVRQGGRTLSIFRGNQEAETGVLSNVVAEEGASLYR